MTSETQGRSSAELASRSLKEIVIIIVGGLIALAENDWWTKHNDRADEHKILASIREDVDATLKLIQETRTRVETDIQKLKVFSAGSAGEAGQYDAERMAEGLHSLRDVPPLAKVTATHKELQTSSASGP